MKFEDVYFLWKCWIFQPAMLVYQSIPQISPTPLVGGFEYLFICTPTWGNGPIWVILFKWDETTNYTLVNEHSNVLLGPKWRCISYWKWGIFQPAMLVYRRVTTANSGWFIMENPIKMDDLEGNPPFKETPNYPKCFLLFQKQPIHLCHHRSWLRLERVKR